MQLKPNQIPILIILLAISSQRNDILWLFFIKYQKFKKGVIK